MMRYSSLKYAEALSEMEQEGTLSQKEFRNLLKTLRHRGDLPKLPDILKLFEKLSLKKSGIAKVEVISARDVSQETEPAIRSRFGRSALINFVVKSEVIGGIILKINDETVIDASVKRRLDKLFSN